MYFTYTLSLIMHNIRETYCRDVLVVTVYDCTSVLVPSTYGMWYDKICTGPSAIERRKASPAPRISCALDFST